MGEWVRFGERGEEYKSELVNWHKSIMCGRFSKPERSNSCNKESVEIKHLPANVFNMLYIFRCPIKKLKGSPY